MIVFPCSQCGQCLQARTEWSGKQVRCRNCGRTVPVPDAETAVTLPPSLPPDTDQGETLAPEPTAVLAETVRQVAGYEVFGELGRGGMGVVYKARQKSLKRVV